jgi:hypothetical protein
MAIDWDSVDKDIDDALDSAKARTNEQLAASIASMTRLTHDEIMQLFPTPADVKQLSLLMQIVRSADDRNRKLNQLIENIEGVAGAVITIVNRFA